MADMKPRHAAALALVGWYLMMPPMGNGKVYVTAPLTKWLGISYARKVGNPCGANQ